MIFFVWNGSVVILAVYATSAQLAQSMTSTPFIFDLACPLFQHIRVNQAESMLILLCTLIFILLDALIVRWFKVSNQLLLSLWKILKTSWEFWWCIWECRKFTIPTHGYARMLLILIETSSIWGNRVLQNSYSQAYYTFFLPFNPNCWC